MVEGGERLAGGQPASPRTTPSRPSRQDASLSGETYSHSRPREAAATIEEQQPAVGQRSEMFPGQPDWVAAAISPRQRSASRFVVVGGLAGVFLGCLGGVGVLCSVGGCRTNHSAFRCINWSWDTTIRIAARIADCWAVPKFAPVIWTASPTLDNSTYFRGFIRRPLARRSCVGRKRGVVMGARRLSGSVAVLAVGGVWLGVLAGGALAASVVLCVPTAAGQAVVSGGAAPGTCASGTKVAMPASSADQQTLISLLPHMSFSASGVGGKPTISFSGVNVQIINGAGSTASVNGTGNLVLGYDENPTALAQTGSHDLILGQQQSFTGYAELLDGFQNTASGNYATVLGRKNRASGTYATVTGGFNNTASGEWASVSGGFGNTASSEAASVSGGTGNTARGEWASVSGGSRNTARGDWASISGGAENTARGLEASISGGDSNTASGGVASVSGGDSNTARGDFASISGGSSNTASSEAASVSGGSSNTARARFGAVDGGCGNLAGTGKIKKRSACNTPSRFATFSWVGGGDYNQAAAMESAISGGTSNTARGRLGSISGGAKNNVLDTQPRSWAALTGY